MNLSVENILKKNISMDDLESLNLLLSNDILNLYDKKNAFFIANFIIDNKNIDEEVELLRKFVVFCLSEKINKKNIFSPLLFSISEKINLILKDRVVNKEKVNLLVNQLFTMVSVGISNFDLSEKDFSDVMIKILNSKTTINNYRFIRSLYEDGVIGNNIDKRNMVFRRILSNEVELLESYNSLILKVLANKDILNFDNDNYMKLLDILFNSDKKQLDLLCYIMELECLTLSKKNILMYYYKYMMDKYLDRYSYRDVESLLEQDDVNINNIVFCNQLISMDDSEYLATLMEIVNCSDASLYVKILVNSNLDKEQRNFALSLINQKKVGIDDVRKDNKIEIVNAVNSAVLVTYPIYDYIKILSQLNYLVEGLVDMEKSKKIDNRILYGAIIRGMVRLLNCPKLYSKNINRFYKTIKMLFSVETSEYLINELVEFACNDMSYYYSDSEYLEALKLVRDSYEQGLYIVIRKLFENANVPYMDDKTLIFEFARSNDKFKIEELTRKLNEEGYYKNNINGIFSGVNDSMIKIIGANILKIRK